MKRLSAMEKNMADSFSFYQIHFELFYSLL